MAEQLDNELHESFQTHFADLSGHTEMDPRDGDITVASALLVVAEQIANLAQDVRDLRNDLHEIESTIGAHS
jgi:adenylosuccinate lyase